MDDAIKTGLSLADSMKKIMQLTVDLIGNTITDGLQILSKSPLSNGMKLFGCLEESTQNRQVICPPKDVCLPRCLVSIVRNVRIGEVIIIPFKIRNRSNIEKTYKLGVRPFTDELGNIIARPTLDSLNAKVQPGAAVLREMKLEVGKGFVAGELYETDIVIQEKTRNQNICVKLYTHCAADIPEALPYDEKDLDMHFHQWYHHYYCREPLGREGSINIPNESIIDSGKKKKEKT